MQMVLFFLVLAMDSAIQAWPLPTHNSDHIICSYSATSNQSDWLLWHVKYCFRSINENDIKNQKYRDNDTIIL